jgi:hypothetical protein
MIRAAILMGGEGSYPGLETLHPDSGPPDLLNRIDKTDNSV